MNPTIDFVNSKPQNANEQAFDYSDGEEFEQRLLAALQECHDIGSASTELSRHITDWPSRYHLSPIRHNLFRPFPLIKKGSHILELGCGCGAITRYLGECGANVTAVEGSKRRATITAERCRDLPNVKVICDNLMHFTSNQKFDVVTLIGVLEYAPRYIRDKDPMSACLKQAASFVKPDGVLLIAIENQLGLKYFNGCVEDHLGIAYYGLHGIYRDDDPTTVGRAPLVKKLCHTGFSNYQFYYPFPDYKLPQVFLSEAALNTPYFDSAALLARITSSNTSESLFYPNFHEHLVWRTIIENELLPWLANSFFVIASRNDSKFIKQNPSFLAVSYTSDRLPSFATETIFHKTIEGKISAEKRPLFPDKAEKEPSPSIAGGTLIHHVRTISNYVPGDLYIIELQRRMARNEGLGAVTDWASDWLQLLKKELIENGTRLPGDWLDKIPQNFIRTSDGALVSIDTEWSVSQPIPAGWVVFRGLLYALSLCPASPALGKQSLLETIRGISASAGIILDDPTIQESYAQEARLRFLVYGEDSATVEARLHDLMSVPSQFGVGLLTLQEWHAAKCAALENEIRRVKATVSWQITKPLRFFANTPRLIRQFLEYRKQ